MKKNIVISVLLLVVGFFIYATTVNSTRLVSQLTVSETLETASIDQTVQHKSLNEIVNFRPSSDSVKTDVDNVYSATLTSGTTIDLTSLTNTLGSSLDLTDEKIVAIKFKNSATTGTDVVTIDSTSTNGYPLFGAAFSIDLQPHQSILYKCDTALTNVSASNANIEYALNGDTLSVILISAKLY